MAGSKLKKKKDLSKGTLKLKQKRNIKSPVLAVATSPSNQ